MRRGRLRQPAPLRHNELAYHLWNAGLLSEDGFQELNPLNDAADIYSYLRSYAVDPGERMAYIKQISVPRRPISAGRTHTCRRGACRADGRYSASRP
jgi:hypothetical protein